MTNSNCIYNLQITKNRPTGENRASNSNVPDLGGSSLSLVSTFAPDVPKTSTALQPDDQDSTAILHRSRYGE